MADLLYGVQSNLRFGYTQTEIFLRCSYVFQLIHVANAKVHLCQKRYLGKTGLNTFRIWWVYHCVEGIAYALQQGCAVNGNFLVQNAPLTQIV